MAADHQLISRLRRSLEDWDVVAALAEMDKPEHSEWLEQNSWDLIPLICEYLTPELEESGPLLTQCCQELLVKTATSGNAKENLVAILEQLDGFRAVSLVRRILPAMSIILMKIKDRAMAHSWDWALDTLACHFKTLPTPDNSGFEGRERLTLDLKAEAVESIELLEDIVVFLQPMVELTQSTDPSTERAARKRTLYTFIFQLLGHPVAWLSQHPELGSSGQQALHPRSRAPAGQLVQMVGCLSVDPLRDIHEPPPGDQQGEEGDIAIGTYLYLLVGEGLGSKEVPSVYSPYFMLANASRHIVALLSSPQEMVVHKGVLLLQSLVQKVPPCWLDGDTSEDPQLRNIIKPLVNTIVYCNMADVRSAGFDCYKQIINLFTPNTRCSFYLFLFKTANHSGILGWTVTHLKDTLIKVFPSYSTGSAYNEESLGKLCGLLFKLSHGVETDLLEISDELIAEINLGYFLLFKCPESLQNVLNLKSQIQHWSNQIQEGVKLSKAHWELKLKSDSEDPEMTVSVGGQQLPGMDPNQTKQVMRSAIHTLDVIQFNLVPLLNKLSL